MFICGILAFKYLEIAQYLHTHRQHWVHEEFTNNGRVKYRTNFQLWH